MGRAAKSCSTGLDCAAFVCAFKVSPGSIASLYVGNASHVLPVASAIAEARDLEELMAVLELVHPGLVTDHELGDGHLLGIEKIAEP